MPHASPTLRQLRERAGVKPGRWAEQVDMARVAYSLVENGHRSASRELFGRCATRLSEILGLPVDPKILMLDPDEDEGEHEHTDAGTGPPNRGDSTGPGRFKPDSASAA